MSWHEALVNIIHREVLRVLHRNTRRTPVIVDSYDPVNYAAKFKLMPDSVDTAVITGFVPLHTIQSGNNYGWHAPPNIGDHGWLDFHEDDREGGTFTGAAFNDRFKPLPTQPGELQYQSIWGHVIYLRQDGSLTLKNGARSGAGGTAANPPAGTSQQSSVVLDPAGDITHTAANNITHTAAAAISLTASGGNVNVKSPVGLLLAGLSGAGSTLIQSTATTPTTFALPPNNGSSGQVLQTDGAGNASWVTQPVATVAQIQNNTPGLLLTTDKSWGANVPVNGPATSGTIVLDLSDGINWIIGLTGNATIEFTGGAAYGQTGYVFVWYDGFIVGTNTLGFSVGSDYSIIAYPNDVVPALNLNSNTIFSYITFVNLPSSGQLYLSKAF